MLSLATAGTITGVPKATGLFTVEVTIRPHPTGPRQRPSPSLPMQTPTNRRSPTARHLKSCYPRLAARKTTPSRQQSATRASCRPTRSAAPTIVRPRANWSVGSEPCLAGSPEPLWPRSSQIRPPRRDKADRKGRPGSQDLPLPHVRDASPQPRLGARSCARRRDR